MPRPSLPALLVLVAAALTDVTAARAQTVVPPFRIADRVGVRTALRDDAAACVVHLHGNEVPAREVMRAHAADACVNVLWLEDMRRKTDWGDDRIPAPHPSSPSGACHVNPNRVLSKAARAHRVNIDCDEDETARAALDAFITEVFLPALAQCRGGARALPVIAYHNNSRVTVEDLDVVDARVVPGHESNIVLVTARADYLKLRDDGRFTVALQRGPPAADGSLSALLWNARYFNVEAQIADENRATTEAMSRAALEAAGAWRCTPSPEGRPPAGASRDRAVPAPAVPAPASDRAP